MKSSVRSVCTCVVAMSASAAFCQGTAEVAEAAAVGLTLRQIFEYGGSLLYVLGAISVFAVANIIYLFVTLRAGVTVPRALFRDVVDKIKAGNLEEARLACDYKPSPFSSVAMCAIDYATSVEKPDTVMLNSVMEGEGARQASKLQGRTQWLLDVAAVAPMVGLLGTVIGMLYAFHAIDAIAAAKPVVLANGISKALITTIAGLFVAIPAMMFYAWFRRAAARQVANLECAASDLLSALTSSGGSK